MAINDVYQLAVDFQLYDVVGTNVMHFWIETDPGGGTPEESLKVAWDADVKPAWLAALHADMRLFCQRISQQQPDDTPEVVFSLDATNVGGISGGEALPASSVMILSLYTTEYTKHGRGRQFISGIAEDLEDVGTVGTTQYQALQAVGQALEANITDPVNGGVWRQVIGEYESGPVYPVAAYEARSRVHSHRSRTGRRCASP